MDSAQSLVINSSGLLLVSLYNVGFQPMSGLRMKLLQVSPSFLDPESNHPAASIAPAPGALPVVRNEIYKQLLLQSVLFPRIIFS